LQIVVAECEKKKEQLWITKDFSVAAQVIYAEATVDVDTLNFIIIYY